MSVGTKLLQAAAGNAGEAVYVDDLFSTNLWNGNNSTNQITNGVDLSGEGGMVWIKLRSGFSSNHVVMDTERGTDNGLYPNSTSAQASQGTEFGSFNSNGYTLGGETNGYMNSTHNSATYCGWTFRKQEKFFDIVTYTGDGNADRQINHNLGSVPGMMIIKKYVGSTTRWAVFHRSLGTGKFLSLDDTASVVTQSDFWETAPTATQFTVETNGNVNNNGDSYVAYLFGHNEADYGENSDEAIIYCDSFVNNSASVGVEVNVGFEPQWLLIKGSSSDSGLGSWQIIDSMRNANLKPNSTAVESSTVNFDFTSRGFTPTTYYDGTLIYVAIRRPNKPASEFAANKLFSMDGAGNASGDPDFVSNGHVVDWAFLKLIAGSEGAYATARLTGSTYISLTGGDKEYSDGTLDKDFQSGFGDSASSAVANYQAWMFRRAKGFFDVVTYAGTGSATTFTHNLGVVPELMIAKNRSNTSGNIPWVTYDSSTGATKYLRVNTDSSSATYSGIWNDTAPTNSVFSVGSDVYINGSSDTYIIYLFASVAGISKVGSYTGTGSDLNVDCGFSAGARFILIKRTDSTGDWYVYDSVRGIVAGDDPYFLLNSTAAQVTNTDYIDPLSSGFTVTSSAPAGLNASSGTYIFLAIA